MTKTSQSLGFFSPFSLQAKSKVLVLGRTVLERTARKYTSYVKRVARKSQSPNIQVLFLTVFAQSIFASSANHRLLVRADNVLEK